MLCPSFLQSCSADYTGDGILSAPRRATASELELQKQSSLSHMPGQDMLLEPKYPGSILAMKTMFYKDDGHVISGLTASLPSTEQAMHRLGSTNLHISPELHEAATASAHKFNEDVDYVLIHKCEQSGVEESIILSITPQSKKESNKCSRLRFVGELLSELSDVATAYFMTFFPFQTLLALRHL
ncbi:hypothetical protein WISP_89138 [Willisornis vidua]|uniref:Uncharacterized protein n=1 Tax=Willisornis vidua TaxID=1566151 RepID=A0ABQ9D1Z1_9PASS|nr:hypothetical protein WISP_89138 [Willisornis vidua]